MRVITFSTKFPANHPRKVEPTLFVEKILSGEKVHSIRAGNRWSVGDIMLPRVWSGLPYRSKQIQIAPPIEIKKIWLFEITDWEYLLNGKALDGKELAEVAKNDGLDINDFEQWFACHPKKKTETIKCQILCWAGHINY